jgi:hypothetical protein
MHTIQVCRLRERCWSKRAAVRNPRVNGTVANIMARKTARGALIFVIPFNFLHVNYFSLISSGARKKYEVQVEQH